MQQGFKLISRQSFGKEKTLRIVAFGVGQQFELIGCFHAFRNHFEAERVGHDNDRLGESQVVGVGLNVTDERLVDLQVVDVKPFQVSK